MKEQVNNQAIEVKNIEVSYEIFEFINKVNRGTKKGHVYSYPVRSYKYVAKRSGREVIRYQIMLAGGRWTDGKSELVFMNYLRSIGIPVTTNVKGNPQLLHKYLVKK